MKPMEFFTLNVKPLFWSGEKQISGDKIEAYFNTTEQNIDSLKSSEILLQFLKQILSRIERRV